MQLKAIKYLAVHSIMDGVQVVSHVINVIKDIVVI